ncbi:hypothetical protein RBG61_13045 [Paludicola sp. MB14-C6]|uniref:hypothetical protein n=1 Tax=Paludihabitans sp. MB14-C6 TaxID=3070656 RepID=UPI0027DC9FE9|nr:hypothetical protein [Paludicola sp. MB14-C6]WMJ22900.1 hypothetical protein RBG61_13045 [Paludicola sp. MB14-C6]
MTNYNKYEPEQKEKVLGFYLEKNCAKIECAVSFAYVDLLNTLWDDTTKLGLNKLSRFDGKRKEVAEWDYLIIIIKMCLVACLISMVMVKLL